MEPVCGFTEPNADALLRLIRKTGSDFGRGSRDTRQQQLLAVASTGVPARNGVTLGSADVAVRGLDYSGNDVVIVDAGYNLKAHNLAASEVESGAYVLISQVNTFWIVVWEECAPTDDLDVSPDPVEFSNVSFDDAEGEANATSVQVQGITSFVNLEIRPGPGSGATLYYNIDSTLPVVPVGGPPSVEWTAVNANTTVSVADGEYLSFTCYDASPPNSRTAVILNLSDGMSVFGTFTYGSTV